MQTQGDRELPSQFYSGLVSELYDSLTAERPRADADRKKGCEPLL